MRTAIQRVAPASIAVTTLALLVLLSVPGAQAAERDRYIVVFKDSVEQSANLARAQVQQRNGKLGFVYRDVLNGYSAELPTQAAEALRRNPRVKYVTVDGEVAPGAQTTPTGISRTFATANKGLDIDGVDDVRVNADVAVIDTGVDYTHPDLNVVARTDCSNGTEKEAKCVDSSGTDTEGHGTHVAGIIGAIDNGFGVVGVAPGARIWAIKVLGTGTNYTSEVIAGIEWVTTKRKDGNAENNIEVANMSLWCSVNPSCPTKPMDEAITKSVEAGVVNVVIAGNGESDAKNFTPANSPDAITVSALADYDGKVGGKGSATCASLGLDDRLASFSNFGSTVDIAAPGVCIYSTLPGEKYGYESGTSMAAPYVAGAAAVLSVQLPATSKKDVEVIRETLLKTGNYGWTDTSGDGIQEPLLDVSGSIYDVVPPTCDYNYSSSIRTGHIDQGSKEDIYQFSSEGLWGWLATGTESPPYTKGLGKIGSGFGSAYQDRLADIDGDGDDDAFQVLDDGRVYKWLSNGEKYTGGELIGSEISVGGACEIRTLDMDGDGKDDLMRFTSGGNGYAWLSNGSEFTSVGQKGSGYGVPVEMRSADFTGDGKDDLLRVLDSGNVYGWESYATEGKWTGFKALGTVGTEFGNNYQVQIGDSNNDGKEDLFRFTDKGEGFVSVSEAIPGGWYYSKPKLISKEFGGLSRQMKVADINGDGRADILKFADNGVGYGWRATKEGTYTSLGEIGSGFGAP